MIQKIFITIFIFRSIFIFGIRFLKRIKNFNIKKDDFKKNE